MRKTLVAIALAGSLVGSWAPLTAAQENGLVIQNNGVDNSNSAAGADNVNISRAAGNSSSNNGPGANNETERVVKEKDRKDRSARTNDGGGGGNDAPAEAAPAEGDFEAFGEGGDGVDVGAAPQDAASVADAADVNAPIKLPNTGVGESALPFGMIASVLAAAFAVASSQRRRHA